MTEQSKPGDSSSNEFEFKEFSEEEDRIYSEAVQSYNQAISEGKKMREAFDTYPVEDSELRSFIQSDFLKIQIAERYFVKKQTLERVAEDLDVSLELIQSTVSRMLQEVGATASQQYQGQFNPESLN